MPAKKAVRKSVPEGMSGVTLNHSRRSPRVTSPRFTKEVNESPRSMKAPTPASGDIRFYYNPKTPPSSKSLPSSSPEVPSTRRRTFQARPSRLSNVYTPVVDTPTSAQGSRRTRRTTALETPQKKEADNETLEGLGATGWTFDQYMGGIDGNLDPASPSIASSKGTRASVRLRKPTTRALESRQTDMAPANKTTRGKAAPPQPASPKDDTPQSLLPAPASTSPRAAKPTKATTKTAKGKKAKKPAKGQKSQVSGLENALGQLDLDLPVEQAGRNLYEAVFFALSDAFYAPKEDPLREYNKAREKFYREKNSADAIKAFSKTSTAEMKEDGWVQSGYTNTNGELIMIAPAGEAPYWFPKTYLDESLPFPPVRSRPDTQARGDTTLGFPPRMGDRNIPFDIPSEFITGDGSVDRPRAAPTAPAPAPAPASVPAASTRAKGKRRQSAPAPASAIESPQVFEEFDKPKRRGGGARASLPGPVETPLSSKVTPARGAKPKKATTLAQGTDGTADVKSAPQTFPRLKLSQPKPEASAAVEQSPSAAKGRKRAASMMAGDASDRGGAKRSSPRKAAGNDSDVIEPKGVKRVASTKKGKQRQ